jgi:hypothetical protein
MTRKYMPNKRASLFAAACAVLALLRCRHSAMVQLSVLLCLIPLALENAMMQAHITQVGSYFAALAVAAAARATLAVA